MVLPAGLSIASFVIALALAIAVIFDNSKRLHNRVFFFFLLSIAYRCICDFFIRSSNDITDAAFWIKASVALPFTPALFAHFVYIYTKRYRCQFHSYFLYVPAIIFSIIGVSTNLLTGTPALHGWGWGMQLSSISAVSIAFHLWMLALVGISNYRAIMFCKEKNVLNDERIVRRYLLLLTLFCAGVALINALFQLFFREYPDPNPLFVVFLIVYQAYGVWRYSFPDPTPENAAETILELMPEALLIVSPKDIIVRANRAALKLTTYSEDEILNLSVDSLFTAHPVDNDVSIQNHEFTLRKKDGTHIPVSLSKAPVREPRKKQIGSVLIIHDLTMKKKIDGELQQAQKFQTIGTLAAGVAHDMNNFLTGIAANISLAKEDRDWQHAVKLMTDAEKATFLACELSKQFLTFARKPDIAARGISSLNQIIPNSIDLALCGSAITCESLLPDNLWAVAVDATQISQVITNLIINAKQAIRKNGEVSITCENIALSGGTKRRPGNYVKFMIIDEGIGMPARDLERAFEPFFTTKKTGTGLGLSICKSIIEENNGYIDIHSKENVGTTITIFFPAITPRFAADAVAEKHHIKGSGRILVMDDEEVIRICSRSILESQGFEVSLACNGAEAIQIYLYALQENNPFYAVILDLTISGGIGGRDAIKRLKEIDPNVRAIASSGHTGDPVIKDFREFGFAGVLPKPYRAQELTDAILNCN